jgi:hypothetical protein
MGNGDGSFQPPVLYQQSAQAGPSLPIVIADFNGDGKVDMAVPVGDSVAVLLGNADGTFSSPAYFLDGSADSVVSADFNSDGKLDIAAAGASGLAILLGKGDGTFQLAAFPGIVLGPPLLTADLNGDGNADLVGSISFGDIFASVNSRFSWGTGMGHSAGLRLFAVEMVLTPTRSQLHWPT